MKEISINKGHHMNSQKGFAHAFLIIGLVVALIGALGFIFWQNFIHKEPAAKIETTVVTKDDEKPSDTKDKTFSVSEYGVVFTLPAELEDATVEYEARQIGEASFLAFTTQRVVDLGGDCAKGYPFGDIVTLTRSTASSSTEYEVHTSEKINGYYYHVGTVESSGLLPASTCPNEPQAKTDMNALVSGLKSLAAKN